MKRPLVAVALFYGAGVVLGHFVEVPLSGAFIATVALALAALFVAGIRDYLLPFCIFPKLIPICINLSRRIILQINHFRPLV